MKNALLGACLTMVFCITIVAQSSETVLYSFGGYTNDGSGPSGGVLFDSSGNIFGVTSAGGNLCQASGGCGIVFELIPSASGWTESILYNFCTTGNQFTCLDGAVPIAGLIRDALGNLYGTTAYGGTGAYGTVFRLSPPLNGGTAWTQTTLWNFDRTHRTNGGPPGYGRLYMDVAGNLYGTTGFGGTNNVGTVFELSPTGDDTYTFSILHSFSGGNDGAHPIYGVSFDKSGNLYGTTAYGGPANAGVIYEMTQANGVWTETVLAHLGGKTGANPYSSVAIGRSGRLYGTFQVGGKGNCTLGACGGIFELVPQAGSSYRAYSFFFDGQDGGNPPAGILVDDESGSAYGTTANGAGNVFKMQGRTENVLYQFCSLSNCVDGRYPSYGAIVEFQGQLYGETGSGGGYNGGVIYSIAK